MTATPLNVLIIGAGTGGLCLAHGLKRAGIEVAVYERDRTRTGGLQGYRVGIDPDGSRALHECLAPDLFDTFVATCARPPAYFNMLTEKLSEVLSLDLTKNDDPVESEKSVSRMTLRQVLLTGLEDVVHFDKVFSRYEQHPDGTVTAYFEDGTSATGTILVAADGTSSRVRRQYLPEAVLEDTGIIGIAGKLPLTDEIRQKLDPKIFNGVSMVFAPGGMSCIIHVMEFKWDAAGVKPGIGVTDSELISRWPGLLFDNTTDYFNWGYAGAISKFPRDLFKRSGDELIDLTLSMTRDWDPFFRKLLTRTDPGTCFPINVRTSAPVAPWEPGNVTLIGDAIHTMTPGRGVGANTALRDASLLCRNLTAASEGWMTVLEAIGGYEARMRVYGAEAVKKSLEQMDANAAIHKPVIGRVALEAMRTGMRIVNHLPPLKARMLRGLERTRGAEREPAA